MFITTESKRNIQSLDAVVTSVINLPESKCPKDKNSNPIPKVLVKAIIEGTETTFGVFTSRVKNLPVTLAKGVTAKISYENTQIPEMKDGQPTGEMREVSNVLGVEFDSKLRFIVQSAKAIVLDAEMV